MDAQVSFDDTEICLTTDRRWFASAANRDAASWAEDEGYLRERGRETELRVPWTEWDRLAQGPAADDAELLDSWAFEHEAIAALLAVPREDVEVAAEGHVGGRSMRLRVNVNGTDVDMMGSSPRKLVGKDGEPLVLSPIATRVAGVVLAFNARKESTRAEQLTTIAVLKAVISLLQRAPDVSARISVAIDPHLASFDIRQPRRFEAKWVDEGRSRVSLKLYVEGENESLDLEKLDSTSPLIDVGHRESVLLSSGADAIARRAKDHQRVRRERVDESALRMPQTLVEEGTDLSDVTFFELEDYSHRILGFEPARREIAATAFSSGTAWYAKDDDGEAPFTFTLTAADGRSVLFVAKDREEALKVAAEADAAAQSDDGTVTVHGQRIPAAGVGEQIRGVVRLRFPEAEPPQDAPDTRPARRRSERLAPVVGDVEGCHGVPQAVHHDLEAAVPWAELERQLVGGVRLEPYQRHGIAWLWHRYVHGGSGALLADDMGLGKTLQVAAFVALAKAQPRKPREPRPTLIVAPAVLIENWQRELTKFFAGRTFPGRLLKLHDDGLKRMKAGKELDRDRVRAHDVVLTNYETLARYARSLLGIDWDVVVLDEAQRIKNRETSWSIAARGLSGLEGPERPRKFEFGICSTGTPVENRIHDLWALYDFLSPGDPFGSYERFCADYEQRDDAPSAIAARLAYGSLQSSVLRREKSSVLALPPKTHECCRVPMTDLQHAQERAIANARGAAFFERLQNLQKLYQHPWLLEPTSARHEADIDQALAASPKLAWCLDTLRAIRAKNEKVLVFTLWSRMQWLLKRVIEGKFELPNVRIINGDPRHRAKAQQFIDEFSDSPGFDVLVLSPLAAGVGLTITAANHVIHYGRWWNPAKEDQASDRAYRRGQERPVTVYYPVLHWPGRENAGFDVKLGELVERKRALARQLFEPADSGDLDESDFDAVSQEVAT